MVRKHTAAEEVQTCATFEDRCRVVNSQSQVFTQKISAIRGQLFQITAIMAPDHTVVHVTHKTFDSQPFFDVPVEPREVKVGKMLRCQTPDGQSPSIAAVGIHDLSKQIQKPAIFETPLQATEQSRVRNTVEVFPHIEFDGPVETPTELHGSV